MATGLENKILIKFRDTSLAWKGTLLFALPALAQVVLLSGLVILQVETAMFLPGRAAQEAELENAKTEFLLDDIDALKGVKDALNKSRAVSSICRSGLESLTSGAKKIQEMRADFVKRRHTMQFFFLQSPADDRGWEKASAVDIPAYVAVVDTTTAAVQAADRLQGQSLASADVKQKLFQEARQAYETARTAMFYAANLPDGLPYGPEASSRERYFWITLLLAYSLVDLVILAVAGLLFGRNVLGRVQKLQDNGHRFAARQELYERLPGNDEIAALDGAFHDMSEAIEKSTRVHKLMMDQATDFICSLDKTGRIDSVSNASFAIFGYAPDDMIGSRLVDHVVEKYQEKFVETFKNVVATRSQTSFEMPAVRKDGRQIDLLWSVTWSVADSSVSCVTHDITETKRAERVQQELVQMVSHDLRSPLVAISGFHEFAERGVMGSFAEGGLQQLYVAKRCTQQMLSLVNDLLEVERLESGMLDIAKADVQFEPVLRQALENVAAQAHSKRVTMKVQSTLSTLYADEHRLHQVLVNLLSNGIRLANPGGQVVVRAEHTSDGATISVSDSGSALSDELKRTIFERFRQIRPEENSAQESGSGLGLSICKALVNLHGGFIWVDSGPEGGSKFSFTIPDQKQASRSKSSSQGPQHTQHPQHPQDSQRQSGESGGASTS